jgi:hypothetical protein
MPVGFGSFVLVDGYGDGFIYPPIRKVLKREAGFLNIYFKSFVAGVLSELSFLLTILFVPYGMLWVRHMIEDMFSWW